MAVVTLLPRPPPAPVGQPFPSSVILPRKTPRKLARKKCEFCRKAKVKCLWPHASGCLRCHQKKLECPGPTEARVPAPAVHPTPGAALGLAVASAKLSRAGLGTLKSLNADEGLTPDAAQLEQLKRQACLACHALGLKCEMDAPGEVCRQCLAAHHGTVLPARLCMRSVPLAHISVFRWHIPSTDEMLRDVWASLQSLDLSDISISFDVDWNPTLMVTDVVRFLCPSQSRSLSQSTSKVGMLCCPEFAQSVRHQVSTEACFLFQAMLYGTSLAYLRPDQQRRAEDLPTPALAQLAAAAGDRFLHYLDRQLQPAELAAADLARRQCLFLLVFGTILAISYAQNDQTAAASSESELRGAMSTHLCERLAHHLVLLGRSIDAVFDKNEERVVLRRPLHRWDQEGTYSWVNKLDAHPIRKRVDPATKRDPRRSRRCRATSTQRVCYNSVATASAFCAMHRCSPLGRGGWKLRGVCDFAERSRPGVPRGLCSRQEAINFCGQLIVEEDQGRDRITAWNQGYSMDANASWGPCLDMDCNAPWDLRPDLLDPDVLFGLNPETALNGGDLWGSVMPDSGGCSPGASSPLEDLCKLFSAVVDCDIVDLSLQTARLV